MNGRSFSFGSSGNPLVQVLALLVFAVLLVGAVFMGMIVLTVLLGLGVIAFLGFKLRAWWRGRGPRGGGPKGAGPGGPAKGIRYIEGEYEVVDADADAERRRTGNRR